MSSRGKGGKRKGKLRHKNWREPKKTVSRSSEHSGNSEKETRDIIRGSEGKKKEKWGVSYEECPWGEVLGEAENAKKPFARDPRWGANNNGNQEPLACFNIC